MKSSYQSQNYKDPRWQRKRLEVLKKAGWKCELCEDDKKTLNVHHRYYISHRMPWEYPDFCFQTLCEQCHEDVKYQTEEQRDYNKRNCCNRWSDWEFGVAYFGEDIYLMAIDAMAERRRETVLHSSEEVSP